LYSVDLSRCCVLTEIDIQVTGPCTALLRYRSDGPPPFALWGTVPLHRYDADPLRAVLRLALHVRSLSLVPELARRGSAAAAAKAAWLTPAPECLPAGPAQVTAPAP
jgi:hypothetical protein